jgi:hypothetical protein
VVRVAAHLLLAEKRQPQWVRAPLRFTVKPWLRAIEEVWSRFVQVSGEGKVKLAVKAPTSAPPVPVSPKFPGVRNSDEGTSDPS